MNREKYVNDKLYREGYLDGRKEGINTVLYTYNAYLLKIEEDIICLRERLKDIKAKSEEMEVKK